MVRDGLQSARDDLRDALNALPPDLREAMTLASDQVRLFHEQARPEDWTSEGDGTRMGVRFRPIQRVGVYVPGGRGAYGSRDRLLATKAGDVEPRIPKLRRDSFLRGRTGRLPGRGGGHR